MRSSGGGLGAPDACWDPSRAVVWVEDGTFLGEAVLNQSDLVNDSANYRVWLAGPRIFDQGYGTEISRPVVDYALGTCGQHRVSRAVHDLDPRAQRVHEKSGL